MRKKLLTLATVCTLCVSGAFAWGEENYIEDDNGVFIYTWTSDDETIFKAGTTKPDFDNTESVLPTITNYSVAITRINKTTVSNFGKRVYLTMKGVLDGSMPINSIKSWTSTPEATQDKVSYSFKARDYAKMDKKSLIWTVTYNDAYAKYVDAMMVAQDINGDIISGEKILDEGWAEDDLDVTGSPIHPGLYYLEQESGLDYTYTPLVQGTITDVTGVNYTNSTITYIPRYFTDGCLAEYTYNWREISVDGQAKNYFSSVPTDKGCILYNLDHSELYVATGLIAGKKYELAPETNTISEYCLENLNHITLVATNPDIEIQGSGELGGQDNILIKPGELEKTPINDKVCKVTGVVTSASIAKFDIGDYLNADFTDAVITGGETLQIEVPTNKLYYFAEGANVKGTNVVIDIDCKNYVIKDTENGSPVLTDIYVYKPFAAQQAVYERSFTAGKYATLAMPFVGDANEYIQTSSLTSYDPETQKMVFTRENMSANKPYLAYVVTSTNQILGTKATVSATRENTITENGATMKTSYTTMYASNGDFDLANDYFFSAKGTLSFIGATAGLRPGRAYMNVPTGPKKTSTQSITIEIVDEDGNFTTINGIEGETDIDGVVSEDAANDTTVIATKYYNMNGTQVNTPVAGPNIVKEILANGKINTKKVVF